MTNRNEKGNDIMEIQGKVETIIVSRPLDLEERYKLLQIKLNQGWQLAQDPDTTTFTFIRPLAPPIQHKTFTGKITGTAQVIRAPGNEWMDDPEHPNHEKLRNGEPLISAQG